MKNNRLSYVFSLGLILISFQVQSIEINLNGVLGAEYTDNARKSAVDEESDVKTTLAVNVGLNYEFKDLDAVVNYDIRYHDYDKDTQDDTKTINGDARVVFAQFKNKLVWRLSNSRRNIVRDKSLLDVQDNRQDRSITSISPELTLNLTGSNALITNLKYSDISYEDSEDLDSERQGGVVSFRHLISKVDNLSLRLTYDDVTFGDDDADYEYTQAALIYSTTLSRINYQLALGINESSVDDEDVDGDYINATVNYSHNGSEISFDLNQQLTDPSQGNDNQFLLEGSQFDGLDTTLDVYERSSAGLRYSSDFICESCNFSLGAVYIEEDFDNDIFDNDEYGVDVSFTYNLNSSTSLGASAGYRDYTFDDESRFGFERNNYELFFNTVFAKTLSLRAYVRMEERDSDSGGTSFDESVIGFAANYRFYSYAR